MLRDQVEITRLAEICEKSPAIAKLIEASVTSEGRVALEAARAKLRRPAWYLRVWNAITGKGRQ
jgi:hypothetical protein